MKRIAAAIGLGVFMVAAQARAADDPTVGELLTEYDQHPEERETIRNIFLWVQDGLETANSTLSIVRHESPLYCQPETLALTGEKLIDILKRVAKASPAIGDSEFDHGLLFALAFTYPCK
jgi:hypothetical protein